MYRARPSLLLLLLLFVILPTLTQADPILTFPEDSSRVSAPLSGNWNSVFDNKNSTVDVRSQHPAVTFTPLRSNLTLTYIKDGGKYKNSKSGAKYKEAKYKHHKNGQNDDQGEDEGEDEDGGGHHATAVSEPPMATTLAVGLALLLFKLRRSR